MNRKLEIESRLERSLRKQVTAPTLDGRFDAAVWSRIAAEEKRVAPPAPARMPGWLLACNVVGVVVTVMLLAYYVANSMTGVALDVNVGIEMPALSAEQQAKWMNYVGYAIALVAIGFGLSFTSLSRRLRSLLG